MNSIEPLDPPPILFIIRIIIMFFKIFKWIFEFDLKRDFCASRLKSIKRLEFAILLLGGIFRDSFFIHSLLIWWNLCDILKNITFLETWNQIFSVIRGAAWGLLPHQASQMRWLWDSSGRHSDSANFMSPSSFLKRWRDKYSKLDVGKGLDWHPSRKRYRNLQLVQVHEKKSFWIWRCQFH